VPKAQESSCMGAAVLGLHAIGAIPSLEAVADMIGETESCRPDPGNVEPYKLLAGIFERLPAVLHDAYREISEYQRAM